MEYLHTPNLPQKRISAVLMDYRTPENIISALKKMNINVFFTKQCSKLYSAVDGHADMTITHIQDDIFVCEPDSYNYYKNLGIDVICGNSRLTDTYPHDIAYNVARVGQIAFHNAKYTDKIILEYFNQFSIKLIDVKQGYSKCSVCVVDENSIITSDRSIAKAAEENNVDVLLISPGQIALPGMNYGFIGGCTGKLDKNTLAVCGNLFQHADYLNIRRFCADRNVDIVMLSDSAPVDVGTIIPLYY